MSKPKICFYAPSAYPTLSQTNINLVGGAEVQQTLLAKALLNYGFDVSFIVSDHGQKPIEVLDGIKIFKIYPSDAPPISRFSKLYSIWKALIQANADIYYRRSTNLLSILIIVFFCFIKKRKFVYSISSDMDVYPIPIYVKNKKFLFGYIYTLEIKIANYVIAQSKRQQELLKKNFNIHSIIIKSGHILPKEKTKKGTHSTILWVGTMKKDWKRPELFLKLAKAIPNAEFQMIGGQMQRDQQYYERIKESANKIPNLDFVGFVPYHEVNQYFDRASIFVNTSPKEGFPDTFIQSWARYTPVVSLNVDPDEIICKYKLGFHSKTFDKMVEDVKLLLDDNELREKMGENGRNYVEREHDIIKITREYNALFKKLLRR